MAFLGASFRFCAAAPPNHPHIAESYEIDRVFGREEEGGEEGDSIASRSQGLEKERSAEWVWYGKHCPERESLEIGSQRRCRVLRRRRLPSLVDKLTLEF